MVSPPRILLKSLPPAACRIVVTGSECTGKTTLSQSLAVQLNALWLPEYARTYAASRGHPLTVADVPAIAHGQIDMEDAALRSAPERIVQDTDLVSTVVYARHYYGTCPEWIVTAAQRRRAPVYLLCDIDIPWASDGIRDQPLARHIVHELFRETLASLGATFTPISGLGAIRLQQALRAIGDRTTFHP